MYRNRITSWQSIAKKVLYMHQRAPTYFNKLFPNGCFMFHVTNTMDSVMRIKVENVFGLLAYT